MVDGHTRAISREQAGSRSTTTRTLNDRPSPFPLPSSATLLVVTVLALIAAIVLGLAARGPNVLDRDVDISIALQRFEGGFVEVVADVANAIGSTPGASIVIAIAILVAAVKRAWPELAFLVSLLVLRLIGTQIKPIFDSPRPTEDLVTIVGTFGGTGYPSGHAMTGATIALGLAVTAWRRIPSGPLAIGTIALLIVLGLVIGWARIWTGAHWPSDVIGGYLFGIAIVAASILITRWVGPKLPHTVAR